MSSDIIQVPDNPDIEQEPQPSHIEKWNNLAGDKELCDKLWGWCYQMFTHFDQQEQRQKMTKNLGVMDMADRMYTVALRRDSSSDNYQNTLSDVASTMFFRHTRTVVANEALIFLGDQELPARYEPEVTSMELTKDEGIAIANQKQALEQFTWDEDKRVPKMKESLLFNEKYGQEMLSICWDRRVERRRARVVVERDENGRPTKYDFEEVMRVVADYPSLSRHDLKDCWFDAQIDDMDRQQCLLVRSQELYGNLVAQEAAGQIMNVGNINRGNFYTGESQPASNDVLEERLENADMRESSEADGLVDIWNIMCIVPISEKKTKGKLNGKGKWDEKKNIAVRYWATYAGKMGGEATCLRLIREPYNHGKTGFKLVHSDKDDRGAYHVGAAQRILPLYNEATTNINQAFDNNTLTNLTMWITDGPIRTRDLKSRANKLIQTDRGVKFEQVAIRDTTGITMAMNDRIENDAAKTMGADKPIAGEIAFARTSATEAKQSLDQALAPIDEKASYIAEQVFPWMFEIDAELWEQFGNPDSIRSITRNDLIEETEPLDLFGPTKVKVTAVTRFRNTTVRRQELNNFISNSLPIFQPVMGKKGLAALGRQAFKILGLENVDELLPMDFEFDARSRAIEENVKILEEGIPDEPQPEENHAVHISVHEPALRQHELLPEDQQDKEKMRQMRLHIEIHRSFIAQEPAGERQAQLGEAEGPTLEGEIVGEEIAAEEGAAQ